MFKTMKEGEKGWARILFFGLLFFLGAFFFCRYLFLAVLPFLFAFAAAGLLHKPAAKLSKILRLPYKVTAVGLSVLSVSLFLFLFGFLIWQTALEIGDFARATLNGENGFSAELSAFMSRVNERISRFPLFSGENASEMRESVMGTLSEMAKNALVSAASRFPAFAAKLVSMVPQTFIFFAVTVLSAVYFCVDYEKITAFVKQMLSDARFLFLQRMLSVVGKTAAAFAKSYLLLFVFTFAELFLGFVLLGESYAFLLALVTALVDSLPIFGTGTVLVPFALFRFMTGDTRGGIGLCVLYLAVTVIRQVLEPRILGAGMGIHPLPMLMAMYLGFHLFGIFGMLIAPFCAAIVKNLLTLGRKAHEKTS